MISQHNEAAMLVHMMKTKMFKRRGRFGTKFMKSIVRVLRKRKPKESMTKKEGKGRELRRDFSVMHKLEVKKERKDKRCLRKNL
jgi:hypothetical protein